MSQLNFYRNNLSKWQEFANSLNISESGYTFDQNEKTRFALLIELQYDLKDEDSDLIRYLLRQEIIARENGSIDSAGDALLLNIYLLAQFNNYKDVILFHDAKYSNFDASCAVDTRFILYALKDKDEDFIKQNLPEIYNDIKKCDSETQCKSALTEWWESLSDVYPKKAQDEYSYTLYERSLYFNNYDLAREYLEKWKEETPDSADKNSVLKHAYGELEEYSKVIELLKEELAAIDSHWDRTSCYHSLLEFYSKSNQSLEGLEVVKLINNELKQFNDWKGNGLGRMTIEQIFEFSLLTDNHEIAIEAFNIGYKWLGKIRGDISYIGLKTALNAATKFGLIKESDQLEKLVLAEKRKLDKDFESDNWFKSAMARLFGTL